MDYTKIISALGRVKVALDAKIDAVNTNVNNLANALDKTLTSIKQEVTGVKTDVADVKQAITDANALADQINGEVV